MANRDDISALRLIGDIGGTNARFAIAQNGKYRELQHLHVKDHPTLADAITAYLSALPRDLIPTCGALAVAGPVCGDDIKLTNSSWSFSVASLKTALQLTKLVVVNDFAGTAMAIPFLPEEHRLTIGTPLVARRGPVGVIGPGTGLGICSLAPSSGSWLLLPGEGGHATMAAATQEESDILGIIRRRFDHVSAERVLSGAGLVNLYEALCAIDGKPPESLSPADVTDRVMARTDKTCMKAFDTFCSMLGTIAGNLALTVGATGGIYIAGGILLHVKDAFVKSGFRERFEDKGRFKEYLEKIPTFMILDESPALLGLANILLDTKF